MLLISVIFPTCLTINSIAENMPVRNRQEFLSRDSEGKRYSKLKPDKRHCTNVQILDLARSLVKILSLLAKGTYDNACALY